LEQTNNQNKGKNKMAGIQDFMPYVDDFIGTSATFPTSADPATPWLIVDASAAGTPTYVRAASEATLTLAATSEVENLCLAHGDSLAFDIDLIQSIEMRVKLTAVFTTGSELVFGLGSARSDTTDSVAANAWFKMVGANSTTLVYCETDDGTRDVDDISSGQTLGTTYKKFLIDFTGGKSNVKFYIDGIRVAASQTFDMSGYSSGLQPIIQLQKAANTNVNAVVIDYVDIICKR
jgi:hypothetical protein